MDPLRPDYGGACITGLIPAIVGDQPMPGMPAAVAGASAVVLLLLDGVGWQAVEAHRSLLPAFGSLEGGPITTVAPSTTASALPSITTGLAPSQHGLVGFRMRVDDGVLNVLRWQSSARRNPDPFLVQRHTAFLGRPVPVVTKSDFRHTAFTDAQLRGGRFIGWNTLSTLVEHCRQLVAGGERFVYAYYPGVDSVAHEFGLFSPFYPAALQEADRLVASLLEALPPSAVLLVTADHGQVHVGDNWIELPELEPMIDAQAGDARFRYLYARKGAVAELAAAAHSTVGHQAWVLTRQQLLDEGWLGPSPEGSIGRRVGDVVLAAHEPVGFVDPALPKERRLLAMHGSLTPDEMLVPLLAGRGQAG
ncbi:MAG TPA: alkaline phosphatase family protein [Acidimicrobiia bacterium]|nr:alkaline phosphatase family protein [Acidimicrobiia bacterium]